jgi:uncharacterized membrane protein YoaK (UPF0700 family)
VLGRLQVIPEKDLGALGQAKGASAVMTWLPFYSYPASLLWVVFIVVLLFAGAFRNRRILFVLIPALLIQTVWFCIVKLTGMSSNEAPLFSQIFVPLYLSIGILIALAYRTGQRKRWPLFVSAIVIMTLGTGLSYLAYNSVGTDFSQQSKMALIFNMILGAAFLLALAIAGILCRKRFSRLRFAPSLLAGSFIFVMIFTLIFGWIDYHPTNIDMALEVLGIGAILGLALCGFILPFMILSFIGSFHKRIYVVQAPLPPAPQEQPSEENQ